jgi:mRNA interferase MazF
VVNDRLQVSQRDVWWVDLGEPVGGSSGYHRPIVIVQSDAINVSRLTTYLSVPLTGNLKRQVAPWNMLLPAKATGLEKDSVAQTTLLFAVDQSQLIERTGRISDRQLGRLLARLDVALGRSGA